ncbi:MAG: WD40 repeat domain-containing protein, partial [Planctomycetota bacterium]
RIRASLIGVILSLTLIALIGGGIALLQISELAEKNRKAARLAEYEKEEIQRLLIRSDIFRSEGLAGIQSNQQGNEVFSAVRDAIRNGGDKLTGSQLQRLSNAAISGLAEPQITRTGQFTPLAHRPISICTGVSQDFEWFACQENYTAPLLIFDHNKDAPVASHAVRDGLISIDFFSNPKTLLVHGQKLQLIDRDTGRVHYATDQALPAMSAIGPQDDAIVYVRKDRSVVLVETEGPNSNQERVIHEGPATAVSVLRSGHLAIALSGKTPSIFFSDQLLALKPTGQRSDRKVLPIARREVRLSSYAVKFADDGNGQVAVVVYAMGRYFLERFDITSHHSKHAFRLIGQSPVRALEFVGDGSLILVDVHSQNVELLHSHNLQSIRRQFGQLVGVSGHRSARFASGEILIDQVDPSDICTSLRVNSFSESVAIHPSNRFVAGQAGSSIRFWDLRWGTEILLTEKDRAALKLNVKPGSIRITPDGRQMLATVRTDGGQLTTGLWSWPISISERDDLLTVRMGKPERLALAEQSRPLHLAIDPGGQRVVTTDPSKGIVSIIDLQKRHLLKEIPMPPMTMFVDISPDLSFVAMGTWNGSECRLSSASTGETLHRFQTGLSRVRFDRQTPLLFCGNGVYHSESGKAATLGFDSMNYGATLIPERGDNFVLAERSDRFAAHVVDRRLLDEPGVLAQPVDQDASAAALSQATLQSKTDSHGMSPLAISPDGSYVICRVMGESAARHVIWDLARTGDELEASVCPGTSVSFHEDHAIPSLSRSSLRPPLGESKSSKIGVA